MVFSRFGRPFGALAIAAGILALGEFTGRVIVNAQSTLPTLPAQANAVFDGELEVRVEDFPGGSRTSHLLRVQERLLRLDIPGAPSALTTGTRVRARGRLTDDTLALASASDLETLSAPAVPNTFGEQRTVVILVNFQDKATQPYTPATAQAMTFQTTSDYYREASYGQTWLTGTVLGWFTIASSSTTCNPDTIAAQAEQAVAAANISLAGYTRKIYAFPNNVCEWWGLGTVGGNPSKSWVNGSYALQVVGHELGHNFGARHSHSRPCDTSGCSLDEYGDTHDIMGNRSAGHLNAFQKERFGWLDYASQPPALTLTAPGDYWIEGMSVTPAGGRKALRVLRGTDTANRKLWYYLEARTATGFDAGIARGVLVHAATEGDPGSSNLLDHAPLTSSFDGVLDAGQVFADTGMNLTVTPLWADATGAMVNVTFLPTPCTTSVPTVTLSPGGTQWLTPGASATYGITVTNRDGASCEAAVFDLTSTIAAGWSVAFSPASVTIAPGASASASATITAPATASGPYAFLVNAARGGLSASASGSINVISTLAVAVTVTPATGSQYTLSANVRASDQPVAGASVTFSVTDPNGAVTTLSGSTNASGVATVRFKPARRAPAGTYQVQATASLSAVTGVGTATFRR